MSATTQAPPQYSADGRFWWNGMAWVPAPAQQYSPDGRWRWTGAEWVPAMSQVAVPSQPAAQAKTRPRKKRGRIVLAAAVIVALGAAGWLEYPNLFPASNFLDSQAAATQLFAGLDQEVDVSNAALATQFQGAPSLPLPAHVYPPPLPVEGPTSTGAGPDTQPVTADAFTNHVDLTVEGSVPTDFTSYAENAVAAGIGRFDSFYKSSSFNFTTQTAASHFRLFITTERTAFAALDHTTTFRSGFMQPCVNNAANRNQCVPGVALYFDPQQWSGGEYPPMTPPRIEHEVFHVAHFYILRGLGHAELFSIPGYYWQTEGFATYTQRAIPDPEAYLSFTTGLLATGFFSWPAVTDNSYEDSYAAAPFLDEMVFRSGDNPGVMLKWLSSAQPGFPSSLGLMDALAPGSKPDSVNLNAFQRLWLGSMVDYYFPGLLPNPDPRTATAAPILPKPAATATKDSLPTSAAVAVPGMGVKTLVVAIGSVPDESDVANLKISLSTDMTLNQRAVIMLVKGTADDSLAFCDQRLTGDIASGVKACIASHVRLLSVVARGGNVSVKLPLKVLKSFSPDVTQASIVVFVAHTIADVSAADLAPMHVTLTVAKDLPSDDQATLDMTATGTGDVPLNVHLTSDTFLSGFLPGEEASCHLHDGGWLNLAWQPTADGQKYTVEIQVFGYHGPGVYLSGYDNHPPSSTFSLVREDASRTGWDGDLGKGSVTINDDGQSGSFTSALSWGVQPQLRQGTMTGTFACQIPIG